MIVIGTDNCVYYITARCLVKENLLTNKTSKNLKAYFMNGQDIHTGTLKCCTLTSKYLSHIYKNRRCGKIVHICTLYRF